MSNKNIAKSPKKQDPIPTKQPAKPKIDNLENIENKRREQKAKSLAEEREKFSVWLNGITTIASAVHSFFMAPLYDGPEITLISPSPLKHTISPGIAFFFGMNTPLASVEPVSSINVRLGAGSPPSIADLYVAMLAILLIVLAIFVKFFLLIVIRSVRHDNTVLVGDESESHTIYRSESITFPV